MATEALKRVREFNRRTLDGLAARLYFYFSWAHECTGTLSEIRRCAHGTAPHHTLAMASHSGSLRRSYRPQALGSSVAKNRMGAAPYMTVPASLFVFDMVCLYSARCPWRVALRLSRPRFPYTCMCQCAC